MSQQKIVIVGGVAAGPKTAARARRLDPDADITIVERGKLISYAGCGLPFYVAGSVREFSELYTTSYGVPRDAAYFKNEKAVKVLTGNEAVDIDREAKKLLVKNLDSGDKYSLPYDKLVLATGSFPIVPPLEGIDLKGIYKLNHPDDAKLIRDDLTGVKEAVVIGAGLIGMEAAEALREKNIFVTVVELKDQILPGILDGDMASVLANKLEDLGIEFRLGQQVVRLEGEEGRVQRVVTNSETLDADMVVVAVGVRPSVELAKKAGLDIGKTGAIAVNEYMQTSDQYIYALGDCVENTHLLTGDKVYVPLASTANRQGRVVGDNVIKGNITKFKGIMGTAVLKVLQWNVGRTGIGEKQARDMGFKVVTAINSILDRTHYHPSHGLVLMKIIAEEGSGKILGYQGIGPGDVVKRCDVVAAAMNFGATLDDLYDVDLGYAPPFSTPIDPIHHTANTVRNKAAGLAKTIGAAELKERMDRGDQFVILDVRTEAQFRAKHIYDPRVMLVTLGDIREKVDEIPRDKEIITLCAMGVRSYEAQRILEGAGFKDVKYMEGGLQAWPFELD